MERQTATTTQLHTRGARGPGRRGLMAGAAALAAGALIKTTERATQAADGATVTVGGRVQSTNPSSSPTWIEARLTGAPAFRVTNGSIPFNGQISNRPDGIQGYTQSSRDAGVRGINRAIAGPGVAGETSELAGIGVEGTATGLAGIGVHGFANQEAGVGVMAVSTGKNGVGLDAGATGDGSRGVDATGKLLGVQGFSAIGIGIRGNSTGGTGVVGASVSGVGIRADSIESIAVVGTSPVVAIQGETTTGNGVRGVATTGAAVLGHTSGGGVGLYGVATAGGFAGYFDGPVFVNGAFTVLPGAPKSAAVAHPDGSYRRMYCQESPEPWFEDFGEAKLVAGRAEIRLDPDFAAVVKSDAYHVFLTEYGDNNALFIDKRTPAGFEVRAKGSTAANGSFTYRVVAKRKDLATPRLEKLDREKVERARAESTTRLAGPDIPKLPDIPPIPRQRDENGRPLPPGPPQPRR